MKLKVVKPKPKCYRISYAMLRNPFIKYARTIQQHKSSVLSQSKPKDKYDALIMEMIRKNIIDESEVEIKRIELESMSESDFNDYVNEIKAENHVDITSEEQEEKKPMTKQEREDLEAEQALARVKNGGPIFGDFSNNTIDVMDDFDDSGPRSLSAIKDNQLYDIPDMEGMKINEQELMHNLVRIGSAKLHHERPGVNTMSNLHGLTQPIQQPSKPTFMNGGQTLSQTLESFWTRGGR